MMISIMERIKNEKRGNYMREREIVSVRESERERESVSETERTGERCRERKFTESVCLS